MVVVGVLDVTDYYLDETTARERSFQALLLAESGVALGLEPQIKRYDPILSQTFGAKEKFQVHYTGENGRLQINYLLAQNRRDVLRTLFYRWGLSLAEADQVINNLRDWVNISPLNQLGLHPPTVAESERISNPFQSIEQMSLVSGMDLVNKKHPNWRDSFTVWTDGKIDVNDASSDVIEAICGVSQMQAEQFCRRRLGPDLKVDTQDDIPYTQLNQVRMALNLSTEAFESVAPLLTLDSSIRRIESTGSIGTLRRTIVVIAQIGVNPLVYLEWQEP